MSVEKVKEYLKKWDMDGKIREFDVSSATVELAAKALGCAPERIAKSLTFKVGDRAVMIVAAGDARINNPKYKAFFGTKAKMLTPNEGTMLIGHSIGGVCPFAINDGVEVYLDSSHKRFETVFPACGSSNSAIELSIEELEKYSQFKEWIDVCKLPDDI